ncbi:MAG: chorismate mutase [Rhodospirillaceae bacterium]
MKELTRLREDIDRLDDALVDLLARRFTICHEVAAYKLAHDIPVVLPERIEQVKQRCAERGVALGLDQAFMTTLYTLIIERTCETEREVQATLAR